MNCVCDIPNGGFCKRHQCIKTAHWVRLCQTRPKYFALWEDGRGPGQPRSGTAMKVDPHPRLKHPQVGTALKKLLSLFFIHSKDGCGCDSFARMMDEEGPEWCLTHREMVLDRLEREAQKRRLPFSRVAAGVLLRWAHRNAKREFEKRTRS